MWEEIESTKLKLGVGKVNMQCGRFVFGAATVREWHLDRFKTVTPSNNVPPPNFGKGPYPDSSLVAFQFYTNGEGARKVMCPHPGEKTLSVNCRRALRKAGATACRYKLRKMSAGFIVVDFLRGKVDQFSPRG